MNDFWDIAEWSNLKLFGFALLTTALILFLSYTLLRPHIPLPVYGGSNTFQVEPRKR